MPVVPGDADPVGADEIGADMPMRKILAELDAAMVNREAQFAIGVFRTQECAPTSVPFHCVGENKAIVVLDDDNDRAQRRRTGGGPRPCPT